jgi:Protein of unknown function (DUF3558)
MTWRRVLLAATGLVLAGCTSGGGGQPEAAATTSGPPPSTSTAAAPTPTPTPNLPSGCDELLPFTDLDQALGRPLFGRSRYVLGVAEPSIGRTGRVTCQFGLAADGKGPVLLEVGVSTYGDSGAATERVAATVSALRSGALSQKTATVAGQQATLVGTKNDYNLVVAQDDRTVAVTVSRRLRGVPLDKAAVGVAERVLTNWGR